MNYNILFLFGFGVYFVIYGGLAIFRRQTMFRLGRGIGSLPLMLSGSPAVIFGIGFFIGGIVMVIPIGRAYILNTVVNDDVILSALGVVGLIIAIVGAGLGSILQAALNLGESIRKAKDKNG